VRRSIRPKRRTVALRASVGSTGAAGNQLHRSVPCCTFVIPEPWAIPPEGVGRVGTRGTRPLRRDRDDRPGRQDRTPCPDQARHGGGELGQFRRVEGIRPLPALDPGSVQIAAVGGPAAHHGALLMGRQPPGPRLAVAAEPAGGWADHRGPRRPFARGPIAPAGSLVPRSPARTPGPPGPIARSSPRTRRRTGRPHARSSRGRSGPRSPFFYPYPLFSSRPGFGAVRESLARRHRCAR
jgi:hypothetical protein